MTLLDKYFKLDKAAKSNNNKGKHVCLVLKSDGKPCNEIISYFGNTSGRVRHLKKHTDAFKEYHLKCCFIYIFIFNFKFSKFSLNFR